MHERAFQYYGGIPHELVYDQDSLLVVSENAGDLILTSEFQAYRDERKLKLFICRRADPESKGKIENVVGFVKNNFAKNRVYRHLDKWNDDCLAWLKRTGNGNVHNTTKKRPAEVFALEKQHLKPIIKEISITSIDSSITRTVRKDNTIVFQSNRYSVPLGTYEKNKEVSIEVTDERRLVVRESSDGPIIAEHLISSERGKLIQATQHVRDRSQGIPEYIATVSAQFGDKDTARAFLERIHQNYPRYVRDQLKIISKALNAVNQAIRDKALSECVERGIYSATEFSDVVDFVQRQNQPNSSRELVKKEIKTLHPIDATIMNTAPKSHELDRYLSVLEEGVKI